MTDTVSRARDVVCTFCEEAPATTTWGFPTCATCRAFLEVLDSELAAMEADDPHLAAAAEAARGALTYRERARRAIAARREGSTP